MYNLKHNEKQNVIKAFYINPYLTKTFSLHTNSCTDVLMNPKLSETGFYFLCEILCYLGYTLFLYKMV